MSQPEHLFRVEEQPEHVLSVILTNETTQPPDPAIGQAGQSMQCSHGRPHYRCDGVIVLRIVDGPYYRGLGVVAVAY